MSDFSVSVSNIPNNLPGQMNSFIGRQRELVSLKKIIGENKTRRVTLTGPGGIGKTRLALEVAGHLLEDFQDGVYVVKLTGLKKQADILSAINQVLRIRETAGQTPIEGLKDYLKSRELLLVLDNLEHQAQIPSIIEELLAHTSALSVLGTAQTQLDLPGETVFGLSSLPAPFQGQYSTLEGLENFPAVVLFAERARLVRSDFKITAQNGSAVAKICWRLNGLPLALELAAARLKTLSTQALLARLDRGLGILTNGPVDWPVQQQTMRGTIDLSFNSLSQLEQDFFVSLAVFGGSWTLEAVQAILQNHVTGSNIGTDGATEASALPDASSNSNLSSGATAGEPETVKPASADTQTPKSVNELLNSLVSQSMVQVISNPLKGNRYEMLEIIHEFAQEKLNLTDRVATIRERHAEYYLRLAEMIAPRLTGPEQAYWYRQLELEYSNLRLALNWLIQMAKTSRSHVQAALRLSLALWRYWHFRGCLKEGVSWLETTLEVSQPHPETEIMLELEKENQQILALQHRLIAALAVLTLDLGDYPSAGKLLEQSLIWHRTIGNQPEIAGVLNTMGGMAANQGNYLQAAGRFDESLQIWQLLGDRRGTAVALCSLAAVRQATGARDDARKLYQQAMPVIEEVGDRQMLAQLLNNYGEILRLEYEQSEARIYFEWSLSINQELNDIHGIARSYISLGELLLVEGERRAAGELFRLALLKLSQIGDKRYIAVCLEALAAAVTGSNNYHAARLLGASTALREKIGAPLEPAERPRLAALLTELETRLGADELASYQAEGKDLPLEGTLDLVLKAEAVA